MPNLLCNKPPVLVNGHVILSIDGGFDKDNNSLSTFAVSNTAGDLIDVGWEANSTNQRGEMQALIAALQYLSKHRCMSGAFLVTDSGFLQEAMTNRWYRNWCHNGWKTSEGQPVKNQDLWKTILSLLEGNNCLDEDNVVMIKVKSHVLYTKKGWEKWSSHFSRHNSGASVDKSLAARLFRANTFADEYCSMVKEDQRSGHSRTPQQMMDTLYASEVCKDDYTLSIHKRNNVLCRFYVLEQGDDIYSVPWTQ